MVLYPKVEKISLNGSRLNRGKVAVLLFCNPFIRSVFHSLAWSAVLL